MSDKPFADIGRPYEDMTHVVGNQPGEDNTLVRTPHGTLRWAEGEEGREANAQDMKAKMIEYAEYMNRGKPEGYDGPDYDPRKPRTEPLL